MKARALLALVLLPGLAIAQGKRPAGKLAQIGRLEPRAALLQLLPAPISSGFIASGVLTGTRGELVTTTRASGKFCTKADGTLVSLNNNTPCVEANGLLVEAAHTNLAPYSTGLLPAGSWNSSASGSANIETANAATAPDGTATASLLTFNTAFTGANYSWWNAGGLSFPGAGTYTMSLWLRAGTLTQLPMKLTYYGGTGGTGNVSVMCTGLTSSWSRCSVTTAIGGSPAGLYLRIGSDSSAPSLTFPAGTVYVWGIQVEAGAYVHSYVAATGTPATSLGDVVTMSAAKLPLATGGISIDYTPRWATSTGRPADAILFDTSATRTKGVAVDISYGTPYLFVGATTISGAELTWAAGQKYTMRVTWAGGTFSEYRGGVLWSSGAASSPSSHGTLYLGAYSGGGEQIEGYLSNLKVTK